MSIYISGLEIPQEGRITLQIDSGGGVYVVNKFKIISEKYEKSMTAAKVQPHDRLIDAGKLEKHFQHAIGTYLPKDPTRHMDIVNGSECRGWTQALKVVQEAKTVIEAEPADEEEKEE